MFKFSKITQKNNNFFKKNILSIAVAILLAILFRSFLYQAFVIPSGSMIPNLLIGDYLFVSKYDYGYSRYALPFGLFGIGGDSRIFFKEPKRGDIVVFKNPNKTSEDFVKRVIGLPGDKIQIIGGTVYINNLPLKYKHIGSKTIDNTTYDIIEETLPEGKSYKIYKANVKYNFINNTPPYYVKKDHYFVMGDNRDFSMDSRFNEIGQIPKVNLVGKAKIIFFSIEDGSFLQIWKWGNIRFNRLFNFIR